MKITLSNGTQVDASTLDSNPPDGSTVKVLKTIKTLESQGDYNAVGDNGRSHGAYQWLDNNWKTAAKNILKDENAPMTPDNQDFVAYQQVNAYKKAGRTPEEIDALWNGAHKDKETGLYTHNSTERQTKFRKAILEQQSKMPPIEQQRENLKTQGEPVSVNPEKAEPTFMGNVARGVIKPFAKVGTNLINAGQIMTGQQETQPFSGDYLGEVKRVGEGFDIAKGLTPENIKAVKNSIGTGLEIGSTISGGGGLKAIGTQTLKGLAKQGAIQGSKAGFVGGFSQGAGSALSQDKTLGEAAIQGISSGVVGGIGGGIFGGASGAGGKLLEKAGVSQIAKNRMNASPQEVIDLINPKLSTKQIQSAIKGGQATKTGLMGDIKLNPSNKTLKAAEAVTGVVDPNKTLTENINLVRNAIENEATTLKNAVMQNDHLYTFKELSSRLNKIEAPISLRNDELKILNKVKKAALIISKKNGGTVSSLLDSRKEFDALIQKEFPNLYDKANAPMKNGIMSVREAMNNFINDNLPSTAGFRTSLAKQSAMFNAIDGMATKASSEVGTNILERTIQKNPVTSGLLKKVGEMTTAGGIFKGLGL